jgi:hypothetical protein
MKFKWQTVILLMMCVGLTMAEEKKAPLSYPGGSPFPPGKGPSLTHIVRVFWTTMSGMETRISIKANGGRPTQFRCVKVDGDKKETIASFIAHNCTYEIKIKSVKEKTGSLYAKGQGNVTVRVYGFKRGDFDTPPAVSVQYLKDGQLIGKTEVLSKPVPAKFTTNKVDKGRQENPSDKE